MDLQQDELVRKLDNDKIGQTLLREVDFGEGYSSEI